MGYARDGYRLDLENQFLDNTLYSKVREKIENEFQIKTQRLKVPEPTISRILEPVYQLKNLHKFGAMLYYKNKKQVMKLLISDRLKADILRENSVENPENYNYINFIKNFKNIEIQDVSKRLHKNLSG
jgi:hypothetical protein